MICYTVDIIGYKDHELLMTISNKGNIFMYTGVMSFTRLQQLKSGSLQLVICRHVVQLVETTWSKFVDTKFTQSTCNKFVDNLQRTCRHEDCLRLSQSLQDVARLQQTCCN